MPAPQDAQPEQHGAPTGSAAPSPVAGDYEGYVTPLVRKLAREHGVDLSTVTGTGRRRPRAQAGRARCRRGREAGCG